MSIPSRTAPRLPAEVRAGHFGGTGERRAKQDDAEIGVGADRLACRADRFEDAPPDAEIGIGERRRRDAGAGEELVGRHAVAVGEEMDIARLQRLDLPPAGLFVGGPDALGAKAPGHEFAGAAKRCGRARDAALPARSARNVSRASAIASAMLTAATDCSPDQAGMLLTSSTNRLPSAAGTMSTPAKSAPTALAAATASAASSASIVPRQPAPAPRRG